MATAQLQVKNCSHCQHQMAMLRKTCPHCGIPELFPNVAIADDNSHTVKLRNKYDSVQKKIGKNTRTTVQDFENACRSTDAVFACSPQKLSRQIGPDGKNIFANHYDDEKLRNRDESYPEEQNWEALRLQTETELFNGAYDGNIYYACLSLDNQFLNYGDCGVTFSEIMISHRASCFQGNSAVVYSSGKAQVNKRLRSTWANRSKLCVAMFAKDITISTRRMDYGKIIVRPNKDKTKDLFIEVHIFGDITARTIKSVNFKKKRYDTASQTLIDDLKKRLANVGVQVN